MKFTLTLKWVIGGACLIAVLIVVGSYFGSQWYYGEVEPVSEELLRYTPSPCCEPWDPWYLREDCHGTRTRQQGAYPPVVRGRFKLPMGWTI